MELTRDNVKTLAMDHYGLVAATCQELGIAKKIDERINNRDKRRVVSTGESSVAMILNALGFTDYRLYLTSHFFENKPIERLLNKDLKASDITDDTLGHALDEIAEYGASRLFGEIAFSVALENDLLNEFNHLDTTSFSVHGQYESASNPSEPSFVEVRRGHSKDHRPDLKQVVLSLVVNGPSGMPLFMEPLNGNNSDKKSFHDTIKKVKAFKKQIKMEKDFKWVADSALYSQEHLLKQDDYFWITRVPETLQEAKTVITQDTRDIEWKILEDGYKISPLTSHYGGLAQRWLLVHSEQAFEREKKTLEKKLIRKEEGLTKALWHLGNKVFQCEADGEAALKKVIQKENLFKISGTVVPVMKYAKRGKPKKDEEKEGVGYHIESVLERNEEAIQAALNSKGRFILATNDWDTSTLSDEALLKTYKEQQKVEGGFRFLKDPWFMADSIFLKSRKRIEALMMIMTLCLMIYNIAQYKLRKKLEEQGETLPNQVNKPIKNPTMRWIFQLMEGVSVLQLYEDPLKKPFKEIMTNIHPLREKIIRLFGDTACEIYGLSQQEEWPVITVS